VNQPVGGHVDSGQV
jgi:hypothetical protein